jgi:hypothetical protein
MVIEKVVNSGNVPQAQPKINYVQAEKLKTSDFRKTIPKELIPTNRTNYIFGGLFLLVVIIGFIQFPFGSFLSGNLEISVKIGWPLVFFEFALMDLDTLPIKFGGLILDLILYFVVAYATDVAINVFMKGSIGRKLKQDKGEHAEVYNLPAQTNNQGVNNIPAKKTV